jgi:hypothetical protein
MGGLLAFGGAALVVLIVVGRRRRKRKRNIGADALALALTGVPSVKPRRWNPRPYKGRWWV